MCYTVCSLLVAILLLGFALSIDRYQTEIVLQKYDFISTSWLEYGRNATEKEYRQGVRDLQYMAALPETALLDNNTEQMLMGRRCGRYDDVENHRNNTTDGWTGVGKQNLSWAIIRYLPDTDALMDTQQIMVNAFNFWEARTELNFKVMLGEEATLLANADILIEFDSNHHGDGLIFDGEGGIVGHARYPGEINERWIHFDNEESWSLNLDGSAEEGDISLYKAAVHEIGHVLGLRHSTDPESVMFAWLDTANVILSTKDYQMLDKLYKQEMPETEISPTAMTNAPADRKCPGTVDAVLQLQNITFFFKDTLYWTMNEEGEVLESAVSIHSFWYGLPVTMSRVDAVYYHTVPSPRVIFFLGNKYFSFATNERHASTPQTGRPITDFCLPSTLEKIDAAFVWDHNGMTYIIRGNRYWKFDEMNNRYKCPSDSPYPRDMSVWGGVRLPVDAAFTAVNNNLYFFNKELYWRFDDELMSVEESNPMVIDHWLGCIPAEPTDQPKMGTENSAVQTSLYTGIALVTAIVVTHYYCV